MSEQWGHEPGPSEKGHIWTWSESAHEPGIILVRVCAVDGEPGHDLYLKVSERDVKSMQGSFDLRRLLG